MEYITILLQTIICLNSCCDEECSHKEKIIMNDDTFVRNIQLAVANIQLAVANIQLDVATNFSAH